MNHAGPATPSRHGPIAQLLIALSPLSLVLLMYQLAGWISAPLQDGADSNRAGFAVHLRGPADVDQWLFGELPAHWLQQHLGSSGMAWYDAALALVYATHFVAIPGMTAVVWFRMRYRYRRWVIAVLAMTFLGAVGYVVYPAAPPWMASNLGVIDGINRLSTSGWSVMRLGTVGDLIQTGQQHSNPVAAMPSLHAAASLLVALCAWSGGTTLLRVVSACYPPVMALALVYTGEHYVIDILIGWAVALAAALLASVIHPAGKGPAGLWTSYHSEDLAAMSGTPAS